MTACVVPHAKVVDYLLNFDHPDGLSKARFFTAGGFSRKAPEALVAALEAHFRDNPPTRRQADRFGGVRIAVDAPLLVPDGRAPMVRSVWKSDAGETTARLITAYPI